MRLVQHRCRPRSLAALASAVFLPFGLALGGQGNHQEGAGEPEPPSQAQSGRASAKDSPQEDPILGRPLSIGGVQVSFEDVQEELCLGPLGESEIADARMRLFVDQERRRLTSIGAPAERIELGPDEFEDYLKSVEDGFKAEYPGGEVGMEDLYRGLASYDPKGKLRTQMEFSKLYMPDDPADFPPVSLEALQKQEGGQLLLDQYKGNYEARKEANDLSKDQGQLQLEGAILQRVMAYLLDASSVRFRPAPGVLYRVDGVDITTADIWKRIKGRVKSTDVLAAKQWLVNTRLLKNAFVAAGSWLSDEEAGAAYLAHTAPYRGSPFDLEQIALTVMRFPSVDYYKEYYRLLQSFRRMHEPTPEELKAFAAARTNRIVGQVAVDVDVILCSAYDFEANCWKENGWAEAKSRIQDVVHLLIEEQRPWEEAMERYNDFNRLPTAGRASFAKTASTGRFRNVQRNELLTLLGENDYGIFLTGNCLTDFIFFEQEINTIADPMLGPHGMYLPRLLKRGPAPRRLPMDADTLNEVVLDDYLTTKMSAFTQELVAKNEVLGLEELGTR